MPLKEGFPSHKLSPLPFFRMSHALIAQSRLLHLQPLHQGINFPHQRVWSFRHLELLLELQCWRFLSQEESSCHHISYIAFLLQSSDQFLNKFHKALPFKWTFQEQFIPFQSWLLGLYNQSISQPLLLLYLHTHRRINFFEFESQFIYRCISLQECRVIDVLLVRPFSFEVATFSNLPFEAPFHHTYHKCLFFQDQ